jgi:3-carboxy-cis,cis-muconate cycloisomerase
VLSTLIASAARRAPHLAAALFGSLVAEDERPAGAWHAEWEPLRDLLRLTGSAAHHAAALAEGLRVDAAAMGDHLRATHGLIVSERLSVALAPVLGRSRARKLLTEAAERAYAQRLPLLDVLGAEPELRGVDLATLTDPAHYTGSAAALTDRALERR